MELTRYSPTGFASLRREMDDLFNSFFGRELTRRSDGFGPWAPSVDVAETAEELVVKAELPGVDEKDVSVTFSENHLVIRGEKKAETESKDKSFHRIERSYGAFERMIPLATAVEAKKIHAEFKKGVLEVHLPKSDRALPREIKISST